MGSRANSSWAEWVGAIHMHSTHSDGRGDVEKILRAAQGSRLDFCILTDHDTLAAQPREGYIGPLLFLVGSEVTCADNSHYLALDIPESIARCLPPQEAINAVRRSGGLGILAHPFDRGSRFLKTYYPWKAWDVDGYDALELWTFLVDWSENASHALHALWGFCLPHLYIDGPNPEGLRRWDEINRKRFASGRSPLPVTGGIDAHGYFSYRRSLRTVRTHVWAPAKTGDVAVDRAHVLQAIRAGRSFVANDAQRNAKGFQFEVHGEGASYPWSASDICGPAEMRVAAPSEGRITLYRDGQTVLNVWDREAAYRAEHSGTYRCEVWTGARSRERPWIFSNAVHVRN